MRADELLTLYDYYYWATYRILATAESVTPEQWSGPPPLGDRSLQETLVHMLDTERGWLQSWIGWVDIAPLAPADFPDAATLAARWREEEPKIRAYLGGLSEADLGSAFYDADAPNLPLVLWQVIAHLTYHGQQHRSEAAMLLTSFDHSPGGLDMVFWLFYKGAAAAGIDLDRQ